MFQVVGFERSTGEYEGKQYDNFKVYCLNTDSFDGLTGNRVEVFKIKSSLFSSNFKIGDVVYPTYNKYGQVTGINLIA